MKTNHYIMLAAALLITAACNKSEKAPEVKESIRFAIPVQTKAYTDPADHDAVFQVRDILNGSTVHINNTLAYKNGAWTYGTGAEDQYKWNGGTHNLFGWLETDGFFNSTSYFGSEPSLSGTTLTIPAKTMTSTTNQYDFVYSQSVQRKTINNDYSDVPLVFKHLFAQVSILFKADPNLPALENPTVYEVYLNENFKNSKSATINFAAAGDPVVTLTPQAYDALFTAKNATMASSGEVFSASTTPFDVLTQAHNAVPTSFFIWPMGEEELEKANSSERVLTVKYLFPGEGSPRIIHMNFPAGTSWQAGYKYSYTITYMGGILKVSEAVLPWDYENTTGLSADSQSAMASWVGWDSSTCTEAGQTVTFKSASTPIRGIFRINAPTSCSYSISLTGANADKFSISSGASGTIGTGAGEIKPGNNIEFNISALTGATAGDEANLVFTVTSSGRTVNIDSEVQKDGLFTIKL